MKNNFFGFMTILLFFSFISLSLASSTVQISSNTTSSENYTGILVQLPGVINQPDIWNQKFSNPDGESVYEIVSGFNGKVFLNNPNYSYAYISLPNENYESLTEELKILGFDAKNISWGKALLNEARTEISLPYYIPKTTQSVTGAGKKIAIIDTGLDISHQDFWVNGQKPLNSKVIYWKDLADGHPCCEDLVGHGTAIASIAAGTGSMSSGVFSGIAPNAKLLIWKTSDTESDTIGNIASAVSDAINQNVDVIEISSGWNNADLSSYGVSLKDACSGSSGSNNDVYNLISSINTAVSRGIPVVVSAGNEGPDPGTIDFPSCLSNVIAVGSTYKKDYSSNFDDYLTSLGTDEMSTTPIHVVVSTQSESLDKTWFVQNTTTGSFSGLYAEWPWLSWSGFVKVFSTQKPSINVKIEGEYKSKTCTSGETDVWNPGNTIKGDKFWTWTNSASAYGGVEVFGKDNTVWGWCLGQVSVWGTTYINSYPCSGTPLPCSSYKSKNSCNNQEGCSWCGCRISTLPSSCQDIPQAVCNVQIGGQPKQTWTGCEGTAKSCVGRLGGEQECGTPSTTGCSGSWVLNDNLVRFFSVKNPSLKDVVYPSSSRGPAANGLTKPDVTAPGVDICAARAAGTNIMGNNSYLNCGNNNYIRVSGTSFAAPVVAGEIALLKEVKPTATYNDIVNAIKYGSDALVNYTYSGADVSENQRGKGRVNVTKAADAVTNCKLRYPDRGYNDTELLQCSNYNYGLYSSANQMRSYSWLNSKRDCDCNVTYDSSLAASVNGVSSGDVSVSQSGNISVDVDVKNTGTQPQSNWYVGVEFWNVSDYTKVLPGGSYDQYRSGRINAFYNGKDGTHGCVNTPDKLRPTPDSCPSGVDCKIISESVSANGKLDVGETIRVRCQVPASFYPASTGNQRIMFWIHERDSNQDANNDGTAGEWWWDALSRIEASSVRAKVNCNISPIDSDGGLTYKVAGTCTQYYQSGSTCASKTYADECIDDNSLWEYYVSGNTCGAVLKSCTDFGANYICYKGACKVSPCGRGCPTPV